MAVKGTESTGIVYLNYIPVQLTKADAEKCMKVLRAGKTYARVKLSNPNPKYRGKRGIVWETDGDGFLLEIETVNATYRNECSTLIGVVYPNGYKKIWFNADEVEDFETYGGNGDLA